MKALSRHSHSNSSTEHDTDCTYPVWSVRGSQILLINRIMNAITEIEHLSKGKSRHVLDAFKDCCLWNLAARNQSVTVFTIFHTEHAVRRNGVPEGEIIERFQPLNHVINVFEDHHGMIVPETDSSMQTWMRQTPCNFEKKGALL